MRKLTAQNIPINHKGKPVKFITSDGYKCFAYIISEDDFSYTLKLASVFKTGKTTFKLGAEITANKKTFLLDTSDQRKKKSIK